MDEGQIIDPADALAYVLAGDAHVTFVSKPTGARFTYHVRVSPGRDYAGSQPTHFVHVLAGPDRYEYLGCIFPLSPELSLGGKFVHGRKSHVSSDAPSSKAFAWAFGRLACGEIPASLEVHHSGHCGRCGRLLTTPDSVARGLGPICSRAG